MSRTRSLVAVVAAAACFSTLAIFTSRVYEYGVRPLPLLAWRFALVAVLMAAVQVSRDPKALVVRRTDLGRFALLAFAGYGAASVCFFFGLLQLKAAGNAAAASIIEVLLFTYPAMVVFAGWLFLKERLTWVKMLAVAAVILGCALLLGLFATRINVSLPGFALGLGAAIGYSTFNLLSDRWMHSIPRPVLMTYMFAFSSVGVAVFALLRGDDLSAAWWPPAVWLYMSAIVLIPTFAAVLLYLGGMRGLGASQASIVSTFEPLFTILLAAVVLAERLSLQQWLGAALVLGGVVLAERGRVESECEELAAV